MEWDGASFSPQAPAPPPKVHVNVTMMHSAHLKFGVKWEGSRKGTYKPHPIEAVADTGCQTCTAGVDLLSLIGCPKSYLVPTTHRIVGITDASLDIIGSALLRIEIGGMVTRQMVHISRKTRGMYLSMTALEELRLVKVKLPQPTSGARATGQQQPTDCCKDGTTPCIKRTPTPDRPKAIPFQPTPENVPKLEKWILNAFASSGFNTCTHQPLQGMTGVPMKIVQKKDVIPHALHTPIPVAFHWKKQVKEDLDRDIRLGIIEKVPQGEVTEWCSRMVIAPKATGKPRRTVDYQELNDATLREVHHTPSPVNLVASIPAGKLKTVLDAWNGYHSLMLDHASKELTTFITEWGRHRYRRGPQGYHGTGDAYTRRFDDFTAEEQRYRRCIDDGLLYDDNIEMAFWHAFDHIKLCADNGIVLNSEKFRFARETVEFAGFEVTMEGYRPSQRIIAAIRDFPTPTNITDVRSWFGVVNQVSYAFSQSGLMEPFRCLLQSKKHAFFWDDTMDSLFKKSKEEIVRQIQDGVRAYDLKKPTCLATDWSKEGFGFSLTQKHCKCSGPADPNCGVGHWKLVFAGSKVANDAQRRYSPIEGECTAAVYGLERCRMYTLGCPDLILAVDHNPLTKILNNRQLDTIANPRLQKLKERSMAFNFKIMYVPGGSNAMKIADAVSRHPVADNETEPTLNGIDDVARAHAGTQGDGIESVTWRRVNEAATVDEECVALVRTITDGFPTEKSSLPPIVQKYWGMREELYVIESVPFKGRKMLIPSSLRPQVLEGLHAANQGVTGMLANARERFFWPGLDAAVRLMRLQCRQCNEQAPSQTAEPAITAPPPEVPFEQTVADLFNLEGHLFLAYADRFSGWIEVERLPSNAFRHVRQAFLKWFTIYGVPEEMSTDGGPPFNSYDYNAFLQTWDVRKRLSSAYYPQSNGRAEAAVKSVKRILLGNVNRMTGMLDTDTAAKAIMTHRNTPAQDTGVAPSVLLFGRPLRDHLPQLNRRLRPEWETISESREMALAKRAILKPSAPEGRELEPLKVGDCVQIQNQTGNQPNKWYSTGVVTGVLPHRQYQVVLDGSRRVSLRNRRFLKKILPISRKDFDLTPELNPVVTSPVAFDLEKDDGRLHPENVDVNGLAHLPPHSEAEDSSNGSPVDDGTHKLTEVLPPRQQEGMEPPCVRRSKRERVPRKIFSAKWEGKSHE